MIAPLRSRRRFLWRILAVLLPLLLFAAWRVHRPAPVMEKLPAVLLEASKP